MSRFFISADLEGVCGVVSPLQCYPKADRSGFDWAVGQLAHEITVVAESLFEIDPHVQIVVNDAHSTMTNLTLAHLPQNVQLLSGKPKKCAMVAGLDKTFDGLILLGYHAKAGTEKGVLNHTFHAKLLDVRINGQSYGEGGINALYASLVYQVPTLLASGDAAFCAEIAPLIPQAILVETKVGLTTTSALSKSPNDVSEAYRKGVKEMTTVLASKQVGCRPILSAPFTLEITFLDTLACDVAMTSSLYERLDGRTVRMTASDFETIYRGLQSAYTMLAYTHFME